MEDIPFTGTQLERFAAVSDISPPIGFTPLALLDCATVLRRDLRALAILRLVSIDGTTDKEVVGNDAIGENPSLLTKRVVMIAIAKENVDLEGIVANKLITLVGMNEDCSDMIYSFVVWKDEFFFHNFVVWLDDECVFCVSSLSSHFLTQLVLNNSVTHYSCSYFGFECIKINHQKQS